MMSDTLHIRGQMGREDARRHLKEVRRNKRDPDRVVDALETLCVSLVMGVDRYLRGFDPYTAIPMFVRMMGKDAFAFHGDAMTLLFRACALILEYVPGSSDSTLIHHFDIMRVASSVLSRTLDGKMQFGQSDSVVLLEETLRIIRFISKDEYNLSIVRLGITDILRVAVFENTLLARQAFDALNAICNKIIFPSEGSKTYMLSCLVLRKKKNTDTKAPTGSDKPVVHTVETILLPFLQKMIQQYATSLEMFPEAWYFLEITLQCLGSLIQRALLCHRPATARKMVTGDLCRTLFRLLLFIDNDVTLEPTVRADRMLLCETVLDAAITADWTVACGSLLTEEAKNFFNQILGESTAGTATLLEDPFPRGGVNVRSAHWRDKNHTTSIAALRLLTLACPRVPCKAFGPKPKVLLAVHQWMWEDDMRQSGRFDEEQCAALDSSWFSLSRDAEVIVHGKTYAVDLQLMKMSHGLIGAGCNVSRKIVPFVFHFVDEGKLNHPRRIRESISQKQVNEENSKGNPNNIKEEQNDSLSQIYVIDSTTVVHSSYMLIADEYLESLCNFAVAASGQVAKQLATRACAALLQAAIRTKQDKRLVSLLRKAMRPFCEMLRESLVSADKATRSVVLMMMVWLLHHPCASEWKFCETAQRSGVLHHLEVTARTITTVSAKRSYLRGQSCTEYLAKTAALLHRVMSDRLETSESPSKGLSRGAVGTTAVREAVRKLADVAMLPGLHAEVLEDVLSVLKDFVNTMTSLELSTMGISETMMRYLFHENYGNALSTVKDINAHAIPGINGIRAAVVLSKQCDPKRLKCFVDCAARRPQGVQALIENLVAVLPLVSNFALVESVTRNSRLTCRTPLNAMTACARISPSVTLCTNRNGGSLDSLMSTTKAVAESSRDGAESTPPRPSREYCSQGHRLQPALPPQQPHQDSSRQGSPESLCDVCEKVFQTGFHCGACDAHVCGDCFTNSEMPYESRSSTLRSTVGNAPGAMEPLVLGPSVGASNSQLPVRAHLFACTGDIERFFRTGSSSTRNKGNKAVPKLVLRDIDFVVDRVYTVLQRNVKNHECDLSRMQIRSDIYDIFSTLPKREPALELRENDGDTRSVSDEILESEEARTRRRMLCDAMEERYILYTGSCGRHPYQLTLFGSLYQSAFFNGQVEILDQLESCIAATDGEGDLDYELSSAASKDSLLVRFAREKQVEPDVLPKKNTRLSKSRVFCFHHFTKDETTRCCCGEYSRAALHTVQAPQLLRKATQFAMRTEVLLLIVLHHVLAPLMQRGTVDVDSTCFLSLSITTLVAKSLAASALRVALLPPDFAVPRWTNFILTEARFLIPLSMRERIARFFAYGARRALWAFIKSSHAIKPDRSIKIYPAEWARLENRKYRVNRDELMHDAFIALRKSAEFCSPISIEFEGDVGVGQGPTSHFYTLIAREVQTAQLHLWRGAGASGRGAQTLGGLYPPIVEKAHRNTVRDSKLWGAESGFCGDTVMLCDPMAMMSDFAEFDRERAHCYYVIGAALGRAFTDEVIFPLDLSPAIAVFLRQGLPPTYLMLRSAMKEAERPIDLMGLTLEDVELMDRSVAKSLRSLKCLDASALASLDIPFTLPGDDTFELIHGGAKQRVTAANLARYSQRVVSALLYESVMIPLHFLVAGFRDVVPCESLRVLDAKETINLLCGSVLRESEPLWTPEEIRSILLPDHGYQRDSPQLHMLVNVLAARFTPREQRDFLLFCTGCPRLPIGGVRTLGAITVVKRTDFGTAKGGELEKTIGAASAFEQQSGNVEEGAGSVMDTDWPLPSVNTCFRYLKLPPYPTEDLMYKKLKMSITHGGEIFELS